MNGSTWWFLLMPAGMVAMVVIAFWPSSRPRRGADEYDLTELEERVRARFREVPFPDGGER